MTRQGGRAAVIVAGAGLAIIALVAGIGLMQRVNMNGSGGPLGDGDLIAIPTADPLVPDAEGEVFCHLARAEGRLVAHPGWGLALQSGPHPPYPIVWPHGYAGRIAGDRVELLDHHGRVVARSGDTIEMGGGEATVEGVSGFGACPFGIRILAEQP